MKKKQKYIFGTLGVTLIIGLGLIFFYFSNQGAVSTNSKEVAVDISGSNGQVLNQLDRAGLLKNKTVANIYLKLHQHVFKANVYVLNKNMDLKTIFKILEGDKKYISTSKIMILEGNTIPECANLIAKQLDMGIPGSEGLSEEEKLKQETNLILEKWTNKDYLQGLIDQYWFLDESILGSDIMFPLEGYFAPETYVLTDKDKNIEAVTKMMLDQMETNLTKYRDKIAAFSINGSSITMHQFLSFASVVQNEAGGQKNDQRKIAGVFIRRLEKPMRLQSDVTVNYANQVKTVAVTYNHLEVDSRYNTYKYYGLPVGPISVVSNNIIEACLNYEKTDNMFFFALKDGTIIYSKTYEEHQQVVKENKWY